MTVRSLRLSNLEGKTNICISYNQRDATYRMFFIIIIRALHVSGGFFAHHQELIKFYKLLMMGGKTARNVQSADNNKEHCISCISLVIKNTHLVTHSSMNVKKRQTYWTVCWRKLPFTHLPMPFHSDVADHTIHLRHEVFVRLWFLEQHSNNWVFIYDSATTSLSFANLHLSVSIV
jgi:hypothetical protein